MKNVALNKFKATFEIADCSEDTFLTWLLELEKKSKATYKLESFTESFDFNIESYVNIK